MRNLQKNILNITGAAEEIEPDLNSFYSDIFSTYKKIDATEFQPLVLSKQNAVKYLVPSSFIPELLSQCSDNYQLMETSGKSSVKSEVIYFDTTDLKFFSDHINGKQNRVKVRIKSSCSKETKTWEMRRRINKGYVDVKRILFTDNHPEIDEEAEDKFGQFTDLEISSLVPMINVSYTRITLLNTELAERVTIDENLVFKSPQNPDKAFNLSGLALIVVRKKRKASSYLTGLLMQKHIRKAVFSKYCLGVSLAIPDAKSNMYKPVLRNIDKILSNGRSE